MALAFAILPVAYYLLYRFVALPLILWCEGIKNERLRYWLTNPWVKNDSSLSGELNRSLRPRVRAARERSRSA